VSIADLIGDVDPIKAANLKLPYSDERVIHFGLVPRAHRSIFVLNELPDLQARIQVALFNILQEGDIQIRGFKLRMPLDIQFIFTANPEDYTNRGSIVTPLKDRIESQILTHYPKTLDVAKAITRQEARISEDRKKHIQVPEILEDFIELMAFKARESEYVDENSGVSARMSISAMENLISTAERRMLKKSEKKTVARITDFWGVIPSITGKLELVYEGEQNGPYEVALSIIEAAIQELFLMHFKNPDQTPAGEDSPYADIKNFFENGGKVNLLNDHDNKTYKKELEKVNGLPALVKVSNFTEKNKLTAMELVLHGLSTFNVIEREIIDDEIQFSDPLSDIFGDD
jgi:magnesium chelatase subunit I